MNIDYPNDYDIDDTFGTWLQAVRKDKFMSLEILSIKTDIDLNRLSELEDGYAEVGVTKKECAKIALALSINLDIVLSMALGIFH